MLTALSDIQKRLKMTGVEASFQLSHDLLTTELRKSWSQLAVFPADYAREAATYIWFGDAGDSFKDKAQDLLSELV